MKDYIQQLIELFGHNNYSADTHKKVQQWLADEEHVDEKSEALRELWKQAGEQKVPDGMQQSIQRMRQNLGMQSITSRRNYQLLIWRAAAILLLAVSSVSIYLMLEKERPEKDLVECYIPTAEIRELTLPDGTYVMLNSKSILLLYPEKFTGETRSVYLIGEANFKVKPDKKHPFIVKANDYQVTALGTEFNVNAYPENSELMATLLEGSVKVEFNNLLSNIILKPNEQLVRKAHPSRSIAGLAGLLKKTRDAEFYKEKGYADVFEFAKETFNISRTWAIRFMQINDTYSIDGNSPEIQEKYRGYGSSKLSEMLALPEEVREVVPINILR